MPEHEPLDYRLRCHTKRTDLPADILRDIGEAYAEIQRLQRERDEARREVCRDEAWRESPSPPCTVNQVADRRGWDCFRNYQKSQEALDKLSELDEELGLFD